MSVCLSVCLSVGMSVCLSVCLSVCMYVWMCVYACLYACMYLCMVWYGMVWYGMVWYGMVWYGMVWYGMVWYGMVWYGMVWYGMVWYGMVWYGMVWYGMVWYGMVWYGMVWYGMVWYGMVWYGMVWYGMVWYGMVWYGMVWYVCICLRMCVCMYACMYVQRGIYLYAHVCMHVGRYGDVGDSRPVRVGAWRLRRCSFVAVLRSQRTKTNTCDARFCTVCIPSNECQLQMSQPSWHPPAWPHAPDTKQDSAADLKRCCCFASLGYFGMRLYDIPSLQMVTQADACVLVMCSGSSGLSSSTAREGHASHFRSGLPET